MVEAAIIILTSVIVSLAATGISKRWRVHDYLAESAKRAAQDAMLSEVMPTDSCHARK
jgi:hypothetical protein